MTPGIAQGGASRHFQGDERYGAHVDRCHFGLLRAITSYHRGYHVSYGACFSCTRIKSLPHAAC